MKSKIEKLVSLAEEFVRDSNLQGSNVQPLSLIEKKILSCVATGQVFSCGAENLGRTTGSDTKVRGRLIRWLCSNQQAKELVDPFGIQLEGVDISGIDTEAKSESDLLSLASLTIPFPLVFRGCTLPSQLYLLGTEIPFLNLEGSSVGSVEADMLRVKGDVYLRQGFRAGRCVRMLGAAIGGDFDCTGAVFNGQMDEKSADYQYALRAEGIKVTGDVLLRNWKSNEDNAPIPFVANGIVALQGAKIDGDLQCDGGIFRGPLKSGGTTSSVAIEASRIEVGGSVFLGEGFKAHAEVSLTSARIGGNLEGRRGSFACPPLVEGNPEIQDAICIDSIKVGRDIKLEESCVRGRLRFCGGEIGGDFDCEKCELQGEIVVQRTSIKQIWFWKGVNVEKLLVMDFRDSTVAGIVDDERSWPKTKILTLDGFQYSRFSKAPKSAETRINWLALQKEFAPQPYKQLAKVLRDDGDVSGARRVLFEMECLRRQVETSRREQRIGSTTQPSGDQSLGARLKNSVIKNWHRILRITIGFGYYPQRALLCLALLTLIGWGLYWQAYDDHVMKPTDNSAYQCFEKDGYPPAHYQRFHAFAYSLANTFPVLNIGKTDFWQPDQNPPMSVQASATLYFLRRRLTYPGLLTIFRFIQVFLGWVLSTLGIAAITGVTHKD